MGKIIREAYLRFRKPLAYILVCAVVVLRFIPLPQIQLGVIIALGLLLLQILFEIHAKVTTLEKPRVYPEFFDAVPDMKKLLTEHLRKEPDTSLRWLGMSMQHAWTLFGNILPAILESKQTVKLQVELAMLDGSWDKIALFNPSWASRAKANYNAIRKFNHINCEKLTEKKWSIDVYQYKHIPNWHGLLIGNELLFLSTCCWKDGVLYGGENQYEVYEVGDAFGGQEKIRQFNSWFEYCKQQATNTVKGGD